MTDKISYNVAGVYEKIMPINRLGEFGLKMVLLKDYFVMGCDVKQENSKSGLIKQVDSLVA